MGKQVREIQYFFSSQNFTDGIRITVGVLLPALIFAWYGQLELGVLLSVGALSVSIADFPGPQAHKRNSMFISCLIIFLVALITGFARLQVVAMGLEIVLFSFLFSMLAVYGNRAAAIGTAALLVMIMLMDEPQQPAEVPLYSALVLAGGLWYTFLSLVFYQMRPYRPLQQALGESVREVAGFLKIKSKFYRQEVPLEQVYQQIVSRQILVNEKQEAVRELLFKSRLLVRDSTNTSRKLLLIFVDLVDLFERSTLIHADYAAMRKKFGDTAIMVLIARAIENQAAVLDAIGIAIQANTQIGSTIKLQAYLEEISEKIDALQISHKEESTLVLKKVLINLRNIAQRLEGLLIYVNEGAEVSKTALSKLQYHRFVTQQPISPKLFFENLTFSSSIFKHSFRVALVCLFGFVLTKMLSYGEHSYWVLLTIVVILKPAFSLTKERNYQRLTGTVIGGVLGFGILYFIQDTYVLMLLLVVLMLGTFSFIRLNYVVSVIFMTPFILILFSFLGGDHFALMQERIIDTLLGSAIAFVASYLIFPSWESEQLQRFMLQAIEANIQYLQKLADRLLGRPVAMEDYKLARKEVYVSSANLSAAFQRMLSEPSTKQKNSKEIHRFVVLNHILSSNIATVAYGQAAAQAPASESIRLLKRSLGVLNDAKKRLLPAAAGPENKPQQQPAAPPEAEALLSSASGLEAEDQLLREQLQFIHRISTDIRKNLEAALRE